MIINHNLTGLNAQRYLYSTQNALSTTMERLSSGLRINRASDDAAGLSISEKLRGQIVGLKQAQRNAQYGIKMLNIAEGALDKVHTILRRIRELATNAANDTNTEDDRQAIQDEINQLLKEIDRIGNTTEFNTKKLLDGSIGGRVMTTSNSIISPVDSTEETLSGKYSVSIITAAKRASVKMGGTVSDGVAATIKINGYLVTKEAGEQASDIAAKINQMNIGVHASYTSGSDRLILRQEEYGAEKKIIIESTGQDSWAFGLTNADLGSHSGTDVKVAIYSQGGGLIGSYKGKGTLVQVDDEGKAVDGLKLNVAGDQTGAALVYIGEKSLFKLHIGPNKDQTINLSIKDMRTNALNISDISVMSNQDAEDTIEKVDEAIKMVSKERSKIGAVVNRLNHSVEYLKIEEENTTAAESIIRDADIAEEMSKLTKYQILQQAGTAMLARANQNQQMALQLLQG